MRALGIKMAQLWGLVLATAAVVDVAMGPAVAIATRSLHWANPVELLREV